MPTPSWTYNRLTRCLNTLSEAMEAVKDKDYEAYKKLKTVYQSLTGLAAMIRKESHG